MKQQHTPGPWYVQDTTRHPVAKNRHLTIATEPNRVSAIASVCRRIGMDAEDKANARLIASAPELLEALEAIEKELADYANTYTTLQCLSMARTAIAKAKGEA